MINVNTSIDATYTSTLGDDYLKYKGYCHSYARLVYYRVGILNKIDGSFTEQKILQRCPTQLQFVTAILTDVYWFACATEQNKRLQLLNNKIVPRLVEYREYVRAFESKHTDSVLRFTVPRKVRLLTKIIKE